MNTGQLIDELRTIKDKISALNAELSKLQTLRAEKESALIAHLHELGLTQISDGKDTVFLTDSVVPQVYDWPAFYEFMRVNNMGYLLERRPSSTAYRDFRETQGAEIPGVRDYVKTVISLRKK